MTSTIPMNGRPRKQLSDQLDRMDSILDCLADALPAAVAEAVREGAQQAVKAAVLEVLASPDLRAFLSRPVVEPAPIAPPKPTAWTRLKAKLAEARHRVAASLSPLVHALAKKCRAAAPAASAAALSMRWTWRFRKSVLIAIGVGLTVAIVSYFVPHTVSAAIGGIGGVSATLAIRGGLWVRSTARRIGVM